MTLSTRSSPLESALARKALDQLEESFKVAKEMAYDEALSDPLHNRSGPSSLDKAESHSREPRHNFSGPIYLCKSESHALLGDKPNAESAYKAWKDRRSDYAEPNGHR
jgi:hypothetical protein